MTITRITLDDNKLGGQSMEKRDAYDGLPLEWLDGFNSCLLMVSNGKPGKVEIHVTVGASEND